MSGNLWNYTRDISVDPVTNSESKASITGKAANDGNTKEVEFSVPLKHLSNFWRTLVMPLINCEVSLTLTWSKSCIIIDEATRDAEPNVNPPALETRASTSTTFKITATKLYGPVITLSTEDDNKLLDQLKTGFERTIKWNKYKSEMYNQTKTNNLNCLIDPTFNKFNRLFVLLCKNEDEHINDRFSFSKFFMPNVEIKGFNVFIDGKISFDVPIKNKEESHEKIIEMSKNNDYTTGNLLDYDYFQNHYNLVAVDLSKKIELKNPNLKQQINLIGNLEEDNEAPMFSHH